MMSGQKQIGPCEPNYVTFPFRLPQHTGAWRKVGGLETVLSAEFHEAAKRRNNLVVICDGADGQPASFNGDVGVVYPGVQATSNEQDGIQEFWFDEIWSFLHPLAFLRAGLPEGPVEDQGDVVERNPEAQAVSRLSAYYAEHTVLRACPRLLDNWADRYEHIFAAIPSGAAVQWSDFFFAPMLHRHAARLRRMGVAQYYVSHSYHPDQLDASEQGRALVRAMSEVDAVFFHTDRYVKSFRAQIGRMGCRMPRVARFDLGVDGEELIQNLSMLRELPSGLDVEQQSLFIEAFASQHVVPHRFVCLDRIDPSKGTHTVLLAAERHLDALGETADSILSSYRFFFLMHYFSAARGGRGEAPSNRYIAKVRGEIIPRLVSKYPGIFYFAENVADRRLVAALLRDAHIISGGSQDGLGLAVQEGLFVSAFTNAGRTAIVGDGAGFAIQAISGGYGALAEFPSAGSVASFARSIARVVSASPDEVRAQTANLVSATIATRKASLTAALNGQT